MSRNAWLPWGQWLALSLMTFEHLARFAFPSWGLDLVATLLGRAALPLFAGMVAWHLVYNTRDPIRYAKRLLVIALVAQFPYMLAVGADTANIVVSLAAGIVIASASWRVWDALAAVVLLVIALVWSASFEYGLAGVLLVPSIVIALRCPGAFLLPLVCAWFLNSFWLYSLVAVSAVALVFLVNRGALRFPFNVPTMPRRLWLSWYPLHFTLIFIASVY